MEILYHHPFIKEVIVRADYSAEIPALAKAMPKDLYKVALGHFPIPVPQGYVNTEFLVGGGRSKQKAFGGTIWLFHGVDRRKTLTLGSDNVNVQYNTYGSFASLKEDFIDVVSCLCGTYKDLQFKRLGLRYANEITLSDDNVFAWGNFLRSQLLGILNVAEDQASICRTLGTLELVRDDHFVRFTYGVPNPDYPARVRRKQFVLDYDAYRQGALDLADVIQSLDSLHETIQAMFEGDITSELRRLMEPESHGQ